MDDFLWIVVCGCVFSFVASIGIGANDVANAIASSVGSKALTYNQAILVSAIFEFTGAVLMGSHVTDTVRKGITNPAYFEDEPELLMFGMLCVVMSIGFWLCVSTIFSLPVSTTHSCIGSIIGMAIAAKGIDSVNWPKVIEVIISWFVAPLLAGFFSSSGYVVIRKYVLRNDNSLYRGIKLYPCILFVTFLINGFYFIYKGSPGLGLKNIDLLYGIIYALAFSCVLTPIVYLVVMPIIKNKIESFDTQPRGGPGAVVQEDGPEKFDDRTEFLFSYLQVFTACFDAFAHGANDVANSIGPLAAIVSIYQSGNVNSKVSIPFWVLALGGFGIVIGLAFFGKNIIKTIGDNLTKITPSRGFNIELGSAFTVITASKLGIPVSTTHCQVGSTVGVGLCDDKFFKNVNTWLMLKIFFGWIITLIIAGGVAAMLFMFGYYSPGSLCDM